ncbi:GNAT family protein [uncultured Paraglaciecola sp.]|uniref:GNAT family N-acetyltransferase n=1 Tax=uncultured Paraglaciecola sp. TaxID=1765024 RepID=UPI0030DD219A|tara:strand:- start:1521 stop:2132 length:612 start_codon:yes stop_codon:yes gene_type:complete
MALENITLEDEYVALQPMHTSHIEKLYCAGKDPSIWKWTTAKYCETLDSTQQWVASCLENARQNSQQPFVIVDKTQDKIVGSTSYLNIFLEHKAIEIGFTFLTPSAQRSYVNRRCKLLLLTHAFETLHLNRVALQTHEKNQRSRTAILAIGATFEGIHRDCRIQQDGSIRSSAIYSIIKPEWPQAKLDLIAKLTHPTTKMTES